MSEKDDIFLNHQTGGEDYTTRSDAERQDVASLQTELNEQRRISGETGGVFDFNRVPVERKPG